MNWVVRRVMVEVHKAPVFQEWIQLATWCSGHGSRWAERRTEIRGEHGSHLEAVTVWSFVDGETGAPKPLDDDFFTIYGPTAADRQRDGWLDHYARGWRRQQWRWQPAAEQGQEERTAAARLPAGNVPFCESF